MRVLLQAERSAAAAAIEALEKAHLDHQEPSVTQDQALQLVALNNLRRLQSPTRTSESFGVRRGVMSSAFQVALSLPSCCLFSAHLSCILDYLRVSCPSHLQTLLLMSDCNFDLARCAVSIVGRKGSAESLRVACCRARQ